MTPGDLEFVQVILSMGVCTGGVALVLKRDEARDRLRPHPPRPVRPRWTDHAWLPSTVDAAILGAFLFSWLYGAPALVIHFAKSRWSLRGFAVGLGWAVALVAADVVVQLGAEATIDWLGL
ncbi:MAG: hypothetical protein ACRELB_07165 [Polyangiaceae bacterium]